MNTEQLTVIVLGALAVNFLVLIIVLFKLARLDRRHKKQIEPAKPHTAAPVQALSQTDREALRNALTQKANKEADVILKSLQEDLEGFSQALQSTLLTNATTAMERQLAKPQHTIESFNKSITATLERLNQSLQETGATSQAQLKTEVEKQKKLLVEQFEKQMAGVINAYLITSLGEAASSTDQAALVMQQLEQHKTELRKDLLHEV